jgi:hypothetical protein
MLIVCCASEAACAVIIHYYLVTLQAVWPCKISLFFLTQLTSFHSHHLHDDFGFLPRKKPKLQENRRNQ